VINGPRRPSLGRPRAVRGLDQFDTPPVALDPLFEHEPLLAGVTRVCEPFCGKGNLVLAMRARGLTVFASDIVDRGCPDSAVLDFRSMIERPPGCDVLVSNCAYADAMGHIEHALALRFRVIVLLLKLSFLCTDERYERLHPRGHLCRVHVLAERLQGMHDAAHIAAGGKEGSQSQVHAWFVLDRDYCGPATINPVSIHRPAARMPWDGNGPALRTGVCEQCRKSYEPQRISSRFCSGTCRQRAHRRKLLSVTPSVTRAQAGVFRYVRHADVPRFRAEGWELLSALERTHHGEYSVLMRQVEQK
jgi:hypothetical protein